MTAATIYFTDFLSNIRPDATLKQRCAEAHQLLRERLLSDPDLSGNIKTTFLQGSYRRNTLLKPTTGKQADVDVVVLTKFDHEKSTPESVLNIFELFARKRYQETGEGAVKRQGRSVGIVLPEVSLDLVPTASPSEAQIVAVDPFVRSDSALDEDGWELLRKSAADEAWRREPLRIPDRDASIWEYTNPLRQYDWTTSKNRSSNGLFINVVKIFKHWRRYALRQPERPKGFPLERLVGDCFVESDNLADGITKVFRQFVARYEHHVAAGNVPVLNDYGVPSRNVMARVAPADFAALYRAVSAAAKEAQLAFDREDLDESVVLWRRLFGDDFPPPNDKAGFTPRSGATRPSATGRFG